MLSDEELDLVPSDVLFRALSRRSNAIVVLTQEIITSGADGWKTRRAGSVYTCLGMMQAATEHFLAEIREATRKQDLGTP